MKLYYLQDTKSGVVYYPRFCENKDVELRLLATELRTFRENKSYSVIASWNDSILYELDMDILPTIPKKVDEFRSMFTPENSEHKNEN